MRIGLPRIYRWSRFALLLLLVVYVISILILSITSPELGINNSAFHQANIACYLMPVPYLTFLISGVLIFRSSKSSPKSEGQNRMQRIMQRLAPDEREYLQHKLDEKLLSLNDEGEIMALDDLLDNQDSTTSNR